MNYSNNFGRKSIRLKYYDYRSNGYYFVTICTYEKICYFDNIENQKMNFSSLGEIAKNFDYKFLNILIIMIYPK